MARRKDLAGLAALGALGMLLSKKQDGSSVPVEGRVGVPVSGDDQYNPDVRYAGLMEQKEPGWESGTAPVRRPSSGGRTPARPMKDDQYNPDVRQGRIAGQGGPRGTRYSGNVTGDPGGSYDAQMPQRRLNSAEAMRQLDEQLGIRQGPTAGDGRSVDSTELGRNISNTLNATAGLSVPGYVGKMTQKQYNALAAARRAGEGFSPAEAQAARAAAEASARDKVTNPMAWMAGPKGMRDDFKKGGKVKKMASGGAVKASASRRGDGIAQRGKTRGKMV